MLLRPLDIPLLLKLALPSGVRQTFQQLADELKVSPSEVHASVKRTRLSGLMSHDESRSPNRFALMEFLIHGLKYAFPPEYGGLTRGIPTAYAARPLTSFFKGNSDPPPVWPSAHGKVRGLSFVPLYKHAAEAALLDDKFYELLALADALRDGRVRERKIAQSELEKRIMP